MSHYNEAYFEWQREIGQLTTKHTLHYFKPHIKSTDRVIDFGCGGGSLLASLECAEKRGVEINPDARAHAKSLGVETVVSPNDLPDEWADVIISSHALEHTHNPLQELRDLYKKLKAGGKIIFVTPYERYVEYEPNDINQHLFTWSPMNLGNLFTVAGFKIVKVKVLRHRFPPGHRKLDKFLPFWAFQILCHVYGTLETRIQQVHLVATRPN